MTTTALKPPAPGPERPARAAPSSERLARAEMRRRRRSDLAWLLGGLLVVGAVIPGMILAPEITPVVIAAIIALIAAFRWPFVIAFAALGSIIFSSAIELLVGGGSAQLDEGLIVLCLVCFTVRRVWLDRAVVVPPGTLWFAGFLTAGALSSLFHAVPTEVWMAQALLSVKGIALLFALAQLNWGRQALRALTVGGFVVAVILLGTSFINLVFVDQWVQFTKIRWPVDVFGIPALNGPYPQPAALGRIAAVIAVGSLCYLLVTRSRVIPAATMVFMTLIGVLTVRVKSIVSMFVVYVLFLLRARSTWLFLLVLALLPILALTVIPVFVDLVATDLETYFFNENESARSLLLAGALQIAQRDFPFGAGFGRWASFIASEEYSPEYAERGWRRRFGLGEGEWGDYLNDTQWPAFLGEAGWLGAALFAGGLLVMIISMARRIGPLEPPLYTWIRWSGIAWVILITVESVGAQVFTSAPAYAFAFIGTGIVASLRYQYEKNGRTFPLSEYIEPPAASRVEVPAGR